MSKLRHPFHSGQSGGNNHLPSGVNAGPSPKPLLNKAVFMSNICGCLESCSGYIQALNSLCAAGTVLAHSLIQVFHELPPYRDVAEQFMSTWEDLSKATAGASAAVKTETLMSLQEVLNRMEDDSQQSAQTFFNDNIAAVSSCLVSYVELQAQFSHSCWKSLSNLSKTLAMDVMFFTPPLSDSDDGLQRNLDPTASIRKYFAHVLRKYDASNASPKHADIYQDRGQQYAAGVWPVLASYALPSYVAPQQPCAVSSPKENASKKESLSSDLEEVINLLSCKPSEARKPENDPPDGQVAWPFAKETSSLSEPSVNRTPCDVYSCPPGMPVQYDGKQTWPRMGGTGANPFGYESWVWGQVGSDALLDSHKLPPCQGGNLSGMWCSGSSGSTQRWSSGQGENGSSSDDCSSNTGHDSDVFSLGLDLTGTDLVASVRHRRHSSSDGFPECVHGEFENVNEKGNDVPSWEIKRGKTSTWPLKQSSPRVADPLVGVAFSPPPTSGLLAMWPMGEGEEKQTKKYTLFGQLA